MAVIPFPDRQKPAAPEGKVCTFSGLTEANEEHSRTAWAENNDAVRYFALRIAGKLLSDPELNQAAPFMVDKIVRMLMTESKNS